MTCIKCGKKTENSQCANCGYNILNKTFYTLFPLNVKTLWESIDYHNLEFDDENEIDVYSNDSQVSHYTEIENQTIKTNLKHIKEKLTSSKKRTQRVESIGEFFFDCKAEAAGFSLLIGMIICVIATKAQIFQHGFFIIAGIILALIGFLAFILCWLICKLLTMFCKIHNNIISAKIKKLEKQLANSINTR